MYSEVGVLFVDFFYIEKVGEFGVILSDFINWMIDVKGEKYSFIFDVDWINCFL